MRSKGHLVNSYQILLCGIKKGREFQQCFQGFIHALEDATHSHQVYAHNFILAIMLSSFKPKIQNCNTINRKSRKVLLLISFFFILKG